MCQAKSLLFSEYTPFIHAPSFADIIDDFLFLGSDIDFLEVPNSDSTHEISILWETQKKTTEIIKLQKISFENKKISCLVISEDGTVLYQPCFVNFEQSNYIYKVKIFGKKIKKINLI